MCKKIIRFIIVFVSNACLSLLFDPSYIRSPEYCLLSFHTKDGDHWGRSDRLSPRFWKSFPVVHADTIYPITGRVFFWNNRGGPPSTMKFCAEVDLKVIWVVQHVQETASFFKLWNAERTAKKVIGKMHLDFYQLCKTIQINSFNMGKHQIKSENP